MVIKIKRTLLLFAALLGFSASVSAYPLLTFNALYDGQSGLSFDPVSGQMVILGTLTSSTDVTPPTLANSVVELTADLLGVSDTTYAGYTVADFDNAWLSILDGDGVTSLLEGDVAGLMMYGTTGGTSASMTGDFTNFSGSLMNEFQDPADLFALELNLSGVLNEALFSIDTGGFTADVYGNLSSDFVTKVPEPGMLLLFGLGLAALGFSSSARRVTAR